MAKYRAGVIGLGWMGMLYDIATRVPDRFDVDDVDRPTPELDIQRKLRHHEHPGRDGLPTSYAEALWIRDDVDLVSAADRDSKRLMAFTERYGIKNLYADTGEMLTRERLDIVAIATNTKMRADLTCLAAEHGARGILTEKPMAHSLEQSDRMVKTCSEASVALNCGAISTTHPSFARAKELIKSNAIGNVISIEAGGPGAQHQNGSYFVDSTPSWVIGIGDEPRRETGSDEFTGQGMMVSVDGQVVHYRKGAPGVRVAGSRGEITYDRHTGWRLWQHLQGLAPRQMVEMPWPEPNFVPPYGGIYALNDVIDTMEGRICEPKNSGRRVAMALEIEIALKQSSLQMGVRVDLPLEDRSLGLNYDWFR